MVMTALHYNNIFRAQYLVGIQNEIADSLSRFQMEWFFTLGRYLFHSFCIGHTSQMAAEGASARHWNLDIF